MLHNLFLFLLGGQLQSVVNVSDIGNWMYGLFCALFAVILHRVMILI